jgi:hypothetical protein
MKGLGLMDAVVVVASDDEDMYYHHYNLLLLLLLLSPRKVSKLNAVLWAVFTSIPQPIFAIPGMLIIIIMCHINSHILSLFFTQQRI